MTPEEATQRIKDIRQEIKKISYSDPFTENTRKIKKNLLIFSGITIIVKAYNLRLDEIPLLKIRIPEDAPHLLDGVLSAALIYFFIFFCIGSYQDLKAWVLKKEDARLRVLSDVFLRIETGLQYHIALLEKCRDEKIDTEKLKLAENYASNISIELGKYSTLLTDVYVEHQQFSWLQRLRVWGLEVFLPLFLGLLAVIKSISSFVLLIPIVF